MTKPIYAPAAIRSQQEFPDSVILGLVFLFQGFPMNIVPLSQPNPWLIELLTDLLARAEQGDLYSLVYCAEKRGGDIETGFTTHMTGLSARRRLRQKLQPIQVMIPSSSPF